MQNLDLIASKMTELWQIALPALFSLPPLVYISVSDDPRYIAAFAAIYGRPHHFSKSEKKHRFEFWDPFLASMPNFVKPTLSSTLIGVKKN